MLEILPNFIGNFTFCAILIALKNDIDISTTTSDCEILDYFCKPQYECLRSIREDFPKQ
jgi:hypothetical protein